MDESRIREGLTFDDVLLVPGASGVLPAEVDLRTRLTRQIELHIPLISAAMDTVTEHETAISMAQNGGMGIVHKNMSIAAQAGEVDKVKRSESGMIVDPITMRPEQRIEEALELMAQYRISGVPVVRDRKAVGILTNIALLQAVNFIRVVSLYIIGAQYSEDTFHTAHLVIWSFEERQFKQLPIPLPCGALYDVKLCFVNRDTLFEGKDHHHR